MKRPRPACTVARIPLSSNHRVSSFEMVSKLVASLMRYMATWVMTVFAFFARISGSEMPPEFRSWLMMRAWMAWSCSGKHCLACASRNSARYAVSLVVSRSPVWKPRPARSEASARCCFICLASPCPSAREARPIATSQNSSGVPFALGGRSRRSRASGSDIALSRSRARRPPEAAPHCPVTHPTSTGAPRATPRRSRSSG